MRARANNEILDESILLTFGDLDFSIYNAILRNINELVDMRVADLARYAGVSNASIVRFCKKCGYAGFPDFKATVLEKLREGVGEAQPLPPVVGEFRSMLRSKQLAKMQDQIQEAYELLRWTDGILFLGSGRSSGMALYGAHLFSGFGLPSLPITSFPTYANTLGHDEMGVVVISQSGVTPMVYVAMRELVGHGARSVSITSDSSSPIAKLSNVCITYRNAATTPAAITRMRTSFPTFYAIEELARLLYNDTLSK